MPATYTQQGRQLQITTPLGDDALLLIGFEGAEEFNKLFQYKLRMLSTNSAIAAKDIVGKNVTFSVTLRDKTKRFFNGYISRFAYKGQDDRFSLYLAEVVPWTWFLTQTKDCRIFQTKTVPQIIKEVFRDFSMAKVDDSGITGTHEPWEYCVQYRESDFDFVSRLMEQEGIYSYFKHEDGLHTLVLGDSPRGYKIADEKSASLKDNFSGGASSDNLLDWERVYEFRPAKYAHADYNFETPSANMVAQAAGVSKVPGTDQFEVFEYPGDYETKTQGEADARLRMEEIASGTDVVHGRSVNASWSPGFKFTVDQHQVADEEGNSYVLCSVAHEASLSGEYTASNPGELAYSNSFTAISAAKPFRPERTTPKPFVHGPQTAIVVGPPGETIPVDKYGRVKVSFFWDRRSTRDDKSSCWIRVSQISGGAGWGTMHHPHTGHEVIVSFIEGDPDRPIITGRVYNGENGLALDAVAKKTQMGIHDHGGNHIIMEGEGGNQRIKMFSPHSNTTFQLGSPNLPVTGIGANTDADSKWNIGGDEVVNVIGTRNQTITGANLEENFTSKNIFVKGPYSVEVTGNKTLLVGGSSTENVVGNKTVGIEGNHIENVVGNKNVSIDEGNFGIEVLTGNSMEEVSGSKTVIVKGGLMEEINGIKMVQVGKNHVHKVTGTFSHISGKKISVASTDDEIYLTAKTKITLECGKAKIMLEDSGKITIEGENLEVTAKQKAEIKGSDELHLTGGSKLDMAGGEFALSASSGGDISAGGGVLSCKGSLVKINA